MGRISRGFSLLRASWQVLKADKELMVLPVLSFLCIAVAGASIAGLGAAAGTMSRDTLRAIDYVFFGLFYFAAYSVAIYFNAAVVAAAMIRLEGGDPTVRDGLRAASKHMSKILAWAAIAASVGLVLRSLEERAGFLGRIVIAVVGAAWSAITFFVVPVLLYEPLGVVDSVKRSGSIFKERWGEQFTGNASIGLAMFIVLIPVVALGAFLTQAMPALGIAIIVVSVAVVMASGSAMSGIFNAALYRYATTGEALGSFTEDDMRGAFRARPERRLL